MPLGRWAFRPLLRRQSRTRRSVAKSWLKPVRPSPTIRAGMRTPPKRMRYKKQTEAVACKKETCKSIISQVFQFYSNLLTEEARRPWSKILGEKIEVTPWTDLFGVEHAKEQKRLWKSFMDCIIFHLLLVFWSDTAKMELRESCCFHKPIGLKCPYMLNCCLLSQFEIH